MFRRKRGSMPVIAQVGIAAAANTFSVGSNLDLSAFGAVVPKESALRENNYESLQLAFRIAGDLTGVYVGGTVTSTALALTVRAKETVELPDPQTGVYTSPILRPLMTSNDLIIAGASNKVQYKLTPGQGLRGLAIKVTTNATPPVLSDTLISRPDAS